MKHQKQNDAIVGGMQMQCTRRCSKPVFPGLGNPEFLLQNFNSVVVARGQRRDIRSRHAAPRRMSDIVRSSDLLIKNDTVSLPAGDRWGSLKERIVSYGSILSLPPRVSLRLSLFGAMLFGIVSTVAVFENFGLSVLARGNDTPPEVPVHSNQNQIPEPQSVLGESDSASDDRFADEVTVDIAEIQKTQEKRELESKMQAMVSGYPIENMLPYILEKDRIVAAFLIGIAKKESAWGKRVPLLHEHDCFNYWGYRGKRRLMGTGGHTCFNSPKDAIDTVSRRLEKLIYSDKVDTPAEMMVVWKCGYDCSSHSPQDTKKWIQDVNLYFHQLDE